MTLTTEQQIAKREALALWEADRARLLLAQPFLGLLAMQLELVPVVDPRLPTAATDGERAYVSAEFLHSLSAAEREFVLAHEVWHCAALHFVRRGQREQELWNLAADHEVNALLEEQGLAVPEGAVLYPSQRGKNAEAVYAWLQDNPGAVRDRGPWADEHRLRPALGEDDRDPDFRPGRGNWPSWPARVVAAAQQAERQHGTLPAGVEQWVESLRRPALPWRNVLNRFVADSLPARRQWMPPNRRFVSRGLYLPSRQRETELEVALAIDTSGSTRAYLPQFLAELRGVVRAFGAYRLRVLMCDADIHSDSVYDPRHPLPVEGMTFPGGGGTDFRPVFERLSVASGAPKALIFLTDGFGPAPTQAPPYPVLWVLTPQGERPAEWGESLRLPEDAAE